MDPINYAGAFGGAQNPLGPVLQGYQAGAAIRNDRAQAEALEAQRQAAAQQQADLAAVWNKPGGPTAVDIAQLTTKYPQMREAFKQTHDMLEAPRQKAQLEFASQNYAALLTGNPKVAEERFRTSAEAKKNAGDTEGSRADTTWADMIAQAPDHAKAMGGLYLSSIMGPEKFADTFGKLGSEQRAIDKAPADLRATVAGADKAESDAVTAKVTAKFADSNAAIELQKKGWDIKKIQEDIQISKQSNRIAAMNAATAQESNGLKREELRLKVQEAIDKRDATVREKAAEAETGAASIDNMLNTIQKVKQSPGLNDVIGPLEGRTPAGLNPLLDKNSNAVALIEQLSSQAFVAQVPALKGMGALSNAEGAKLESALVSLKRTQDEKQFRESLDEASRLLKKARTTMERKLGVPPTKPDVPAKPGARPPIDDFFR